MALTIGDIAPLAITFVVVAIVLGVGADVLDNIQDGQSQNSSAYNATGYGLTAIGKFSNWLPTIAVIVVAAVIIGIIYMYFFMRT